MKKTILSLCAAVSILATSCQHQPATCCVLGPRNLQGNISSTGEAKEVNDQQRCQSECNDLGLSADWFNKPCDQVQKGEVQFEKGTTVCP